MRKLVCLVLAAVILCLNAAAQTREVSGKVTNAADGSPVAGASIRIKGSNAGTSSDAEWNFRLTVSGSNVALLVSSIGFNEVEVAAGEGPVNVQLSNTAGTSLNEVVVVGYGTNTKREITGAISKVTSKEINNLPLPSFEGALQGRTTGVFINAGSGKLGQALNIRIRGFSSISASNQPLFVIDGVPVFSQALGTDEEPDNPLAAINPDDIESIEVLKDASSAAI